MVDVFYTHTYYSGYYTEHAWLSGEIAQVDIDGGIEYPVVETLTDFHSERHLRTGKVHYSGTTYKVFYHARAPHSLEENDWEIRSAYYEERLPGDYVSISARSRVMLKVAKM